MITAASSTLYPSITHPSVEPIPSHYQQLFVKASTSCKFWSISKLSWTGQNNSVRCRCFHSFNFSFFRILLIHLGLLVSSLAANRHTCLLSSCDRDTFFYNLKLLSFISALWAFLNRIGVKGIFEEKERLFHNIQIFK